MLKVKIDEAVLPFGYFKVLKENEPIEFHCIFGSDFDTGFAPKLISSVIITDNLLLSAYVDSVFVPKEMYKHLIN